MVLTNPLSWCCNHEKKLPSHNHMAEYGERCSLACQATSESHYTAGVAHGTRKMLGKLSGRRAAEPQPNGAVDPAKLAEQLAALQADNQRLKALVSACLPVCHNQAHTSCAQHPLGVAAGL